MIQNREDVKKLGELNTLFLTLNKKSQENILTILRSLDFAQSVMCQSTPAEQSNKAAKNRTT